MRHPEGFWQCRGRLHRLENVAYDAYLDDNGPLAWDTQLTMTSLRRHMKYRWPMLYHQQRVPHAA